MIGLLEVLSPCAAGCTTTDGNVAASAVGSLYCERCHAAAGSALRNLAPLVGHLLRQVGGLRAPRGSDGSQRTKGATAPLPFNARAFDDANGIYRVLVRWCARITRPGVPRPTGLAGAWRDGAGAVLGLPYDVPASVAEDDVERLAEWLRAALPLVFTSSDVEQVAAFQADLERLRRMDLRWPREDRPAFSTKAACPDDAGRLLIVPPRAAGADRVIVCSACGRHYTEAEHERLEAYVRAVARAHRKVAASAAAAAALIRAHPPTEPLPVVTL